MDLLMDIKRVVNVFNRNSLQDSILINEALQQHGYTFDDLDSFFKVLELDRIAKIAEFEGDREREIKEYDKIAPKCPECGLSLMLKRINIPQGKGNKNGYKSLLYCNGASCLYEKYSRKPADYLYRQMVKNSKKEKANGS